MWFWLRRFGGCTGSILLAWDVETIIQSLCADDGERRVSAGVALIEEMRAPSFASSSAFFSMTYEKLASRLDDARCEEHEFLVMSEAIAVLIRRAGIDVRGFVQLYFERTLRGVVSSSLSEDRTGVILATSYASLLIEYCEWIMISHWSALLELEGADRCRELTRLASEALDTARLLLTNAARREGRLPPEGHRERISVLSSRCLQLIEASREKATRAFAMHGSRDERDADSPRPDSKRRHAE